MRPRPRIEGVSELGVHVLLRDYPELLGFFAGLDGWSPAWGARTLKDVLSGDAVEAAVQEVDRRTRWRPS